MWYNKGVKRKENRNGGRRKKIKKSQKPLDKHHKVWYNKDTKDKDSLKHQKGIDTMANKVTKKDNFNALRALALAAESDELVAFIDHELELLAKKAENRSTKPTVRQAENAEIKSAIVTSLSKGEWYRCAEIKALIPTLAEGEGTQRTARLCNDLVEANMLQKKVEKKVVYFALAE